MSLDILHRELVDRQTLLHRIEFVNTLVEALHYDTRWGSAGDLERRRVAKRIAFTRHRLSERYGPFVSLRNRRVGRP